MSAVTHHLPQVEYFDWSELADFDESQKQRAIRLLREATSHVERLTLRQAIAEAAAAPAGKRRERVGRILRALAPDPRRGPRIRAPADVRHRAV